MSGDDEVVRSVGVEMEDFLQARKRQLYEEIGGYPTPITACDQQFNYLLEQQANVAGTLARLTTIMADPIARGGLVGEFCDLIRSCEVLDEDTKQRLLRRLQT
jgi:hypothetical protein